MSFSSLLKSQQNFLVEIDKQTVQFVWKWKGRRKAKMTTKKNKVEGYHYLIS